MMVAVVAGLHVLGFLTLIALVAPSHYALGASGTFTIGIGVTAYTLGLRHAFDADHISAIDNTTRKLMQEGKRPLSVGFWFSLGHSTIVFALAFLISIGVRVARRAGRERRLAAAQRHGLDRHDRVGLVPVPDRRAQRRDPGRDRQGVPRDEDAAATTRRRSSSSSTSAAS